MKIAIISDIHDNLENLNKFLSWANENKLDLLICAGDVTNEESVERLAAGFLKTIYLVAGNAELYDPKVLNDNKNVHYLGRTGVFSVAGYTIGLCHEPYFINQLLEKRPDLEMIFYGHTHKPWIEEREGAKIINPGTLGGVFYRPTFALWDNSEQKIDLKLLELI
ncbi:MAG: YfcE family phosphodiesterase [Candidatus Pacebacteria bacterium]|nr:YfcE family phosphodiesterase [Candidatus Paceibacterota bacterium]